MAMTYQEFGQKIKQKFPQYSNLSDNEVAQKVIAKYPQYKSQVSGDPNYNPVDLGAMQAKADAAKQAQMDNPPTMMGKIGKSIGSLPIDIIKNTPASAYNLAKNIGGVIMHPVKTVENIGAIGAGAFQAAAEKISGQKMQNQTSTEQENEQMFNSMVDFFKNRYGTAGNVLQTLRTDPVGFATDVATVLEGGGAVLKTAGEVSKVSKLAEVGEAVKGAGEAINPITAAVKGGSQLLRSATEGKTVAPFAKSANTDVMATAEQQGVKLPLSAMTKSPVVQEIESVVEKGFFGKALSDIRESASQFIQQGTKSAEQAVETAKQSAKNFAQRTQELGGELVDNLKKKMNNLVGQIKPETTVDKLTAGGVIKTGFQSLIENGKKMINKLYDEVTPQLKGAKADTTRTMGALDEIIKQKYLAGPAVSAGERSFFTELKKFLSESTPGNLFTQGSAGTFFENLKAVRTKVGEMMESSDPVATGNKASLAKLYASLSQDMEATAAKLGPDVATAFKKANDFNREIMTRVNSVLGKVIEKANPEELVASIVKPNNYTDISWVKDMLGPEQFSKVSSSFLSDIVGKATELTGEFNFNKFLTQIKRFDTATLRTLLDDTQYQKLQQILNTGGDTQKLIQSIQENLDFIGSQPEAQGLQAKIGATQQNLEAGPVEQIKSAITKGSRFGGGSQTAYIAKLIGQTGALMVHPVLVALSLFGEKKLADFLASDAGRQFFTTGLKLSGSVGQKLQKWAKTVGSVSLPFNVASKFNQNQP